MKFTALILAVGCAVGFSSCCCQTQSMPKLRPFPKDCQQIDMTTPHAPNKDLYVNGK